MAINVIKKANYTVLAIPNIEYVNPIEFDFENQLDIRIANLKLIISITPELSSAPKEMAERVSHRMAVKDHLKAWKEDYYKITNIKFPDNYFDFLLSRKRKVQNKILEKYLLDTYKLQAIFYRAWTEHEFLFSSYTFEKEPRDFANKQYPDLYYLQRDNSLDIVGHTNLSDGQLRAALKQRNVVIAKFLDKGSVWHCFLHTYNGILGKESGNLPHIHYISSAFGKQITREGVLKELSKGKYELPSMIHIPFYRKTFDEFPEVPVIPKI